MSIYSHTPYTYLIGWSKLDRWYYGVRFAKDCDPDDLWTKYFTSSKYVKAFRKEHGEPDVIQIRKTFKDAKSAVLWEKAVLARINVVKKEKWLNKTDHKAMKSLSQEQNPCFNKVPVIDANGNSFLISKEQYYSKENTEYKHSNYGMVSVIDLDGRHHRISKADYKKRKNIDVKSVHLGGPKSIEANMKISKALKGRKNGPASNQTKSKISKALKGRVPCFDKNGNYILLDKEEYELRKNIDVVHSTKGKMLCKDIDGNYLSVPVEEYHLRKNIDLWHFNSKIPLQPPNNVS